MRKIQNAELGRKGRDEFLASEKYPVILVLDNIRSMNNVGSVFRTADAFMLEGLYLCGITGTPPHREIHKTALGAEQVVTWFHHQDCTEALEKLKSDGFHIVAVEQTDKSINLSDFRPEKGKKYAFVLGHEINGVSAEALSHCDSAIEIVQEGTKHSLNVAVCAGIVAWSCISHMAYNKNGQP